MACKLPSTSFRTLFTARSMCSVEKTEHAFCLVREHVGLRTTWRRGVHHRVVPHLQRLFKARALKMKSSAAQGYGDQCK